MELKEGLRKYWPWALGGVVGIYIVSKYMGGTSATSNAGSSYAAQLAAQSQQSAATTLGMAQIQAQSDAGNQAANIAMAKLAADTSAQTASETIAYNNSVASVAAGAGSAIAQVIQAQSLLPATAINSAMAQNQTTLTASASTAIAGINALPQIDNALTSAMNGAISEAVNNNSAFYNSINGSVKAVTASKLSGDSLATSFLNASGQAASNFAANVPILVNGVGTSSSANVSAVASGIGQPQNNSGAWQTVGQLGSAAIWSLA